MKIGVDASTWTNRRGYGRFTRGLLSAMVTSYPQHEFVFVADNATVQASSFPREVAVRSVATGAQQALAAAANGARSLRDIWKMSQAASALDADVFLFPTTYSFFPLRGGTRIVSVMHDASAENYSALIFPARVPRMLWKAKTWLARCQTEKLVTVSEAARAQIASTFAIVPDDIEVVGEGTDAAFSCLERSPHNLERVREALLRHALPVNAPLVMYVGGISPHKNLAALLLAMQHSKDASWHLAIVGDYSSDNFLGNHAEMVERAIALNLSHRVSFTGFVPDDDLNLLYNAATLFVLPSLAEGFGLPVLEAMTCGVPVAVSNTTSLPEVVGGAGILFDPQRSDEIARAIDVVLGDASLRARMTAQGIERAKSYSWTASAHAMMQILERTAQTVVA